VAAGVPIGLLEYNLNGDEQPGGAFGLPEQGKIAGAVYAALLLTRAFGSDAHFTMGALWDLVADSNYGAIGNAQDQGRYGVIDPQGWYLRQASRLLPGPQVRGTTSTPDLQVLATRSGKRLTVQLINYSLATKRTVAVSVTGGKLRGPVSRWLLSAGHPAGQVTTLSSLAGVALPPQSVVLLSGQLE
jgi:hypothetical protein